MYTDYRVKEIIFKTQSETLIWGNQLSLKHKIHFKQHISVKNIKNKCLKYYEYKWYCLEVRSNSSV